MESALIVLGGIVGIAGLLTISCLINGWVVSCLWAWFVVPLGAPAISVTQAIGIALVVAALSHNKQSASQKSDDNWAWTLIANLFGPPLVLLCVGWIVKSFL